MGDLEIQAVEILSLHRHGHLICFGLTEDELYAIAPSLRYDPETQISSKTCTAGTASGTVWDWSKHGGHSFNPKIHWTCPRCDQQWWTDFIPPMSNPVFEASGCKCVDYWFVHWNDAHVANELSSS
jgi:hypothetical protein